ITVEALTLEHDPEKACPGLDPGLDPGWVPAFEEACPRARPEGSCSNNKMERDGDPKISHLAPSGTAQNRAGAKLLGTWCRARGGPHLDPDQGRCKKSAPKAHFLCTRSSIRWRTRITCSPASLFRRVIPTRSATRSRTPSSMHSSPTTS